VVLSLVLPNYTTSAAGPRFSTPQLLFAGTASLVLYGTFVFVQTVRHREYFLYDADAHPQGAPPSGRAALISFGLLLVCLVGVVLLAKALTPYVRAGVAWAGAPEAVVGIVIAAVVLLPEGTAALRAARRNRLQTTLNLGLGSAISSIGLTIPVVALVSILLQRPLVLGLGPKEQVLLALTLLIGLMTMGTGRTTVLQGVVHLVILAAFLFLAIVP
jgi:Ca2+:H+ antiporter